LSEETPRRFTPPEPPPPRVRGRWYSRRQGDKLIIEKWPEQKSEKAKRTAAIMGEWSRLMNIAWKFVHPAIRAQYDEHSKSLPVTGRDLFWRAQSGSLFSISTVEGALIMPIVAVEKISASIDALGAIPGALLVRGQWLWGALGPGPDGTVLTSRGPGAIPEWRSVSAGGGAIWVPGQLRPPADSSFELQKRTRVESTFYNSRVGLVLRVKPGGWLQDLIIKSKQSLPGVFTVTVGLGYLGPSGARVPVTQLVLQSPDASRAITFEIGEGVWRIAYHFDNYSRANLIRNVGLDIAAGVVYFCRIRQTATERIYEGSLDMAEWVEVFRAPVTEHLTGVVHWGLRTISRDSNADALGYCVHAEIA